MNQYSVCSSLVKNQKNAEMIVLTAGEWAAGEWTAGEWAAGGWAAGEWAAGEWAAGEWAAGEWAACDGLLSIEWVQKMASARAKI